MLIIVGGPMFAGKTTWLLDYAKKLPKGSFQAFKPSIDTRYAAESYVTHDGDSLAAQNVDAKQPVFPIGKKVKTILIDELNFFKPEHILPAVQDILKQGKDVVGVGLLYDFQKEPFGATLPLSKIADQFIQLTAVCDGCGQPATQSYRKIKAKKQLLLGAEEVYGPCCEKCWAELSMQKEE